MHALQGMEIKKAYFISPIVNMQILIEKMMSQACVSEEELRDRSELGTKYGEKLSWK
jgi:hydrolase